MKIEVFYHIEFWSEDWSTKGGTWSGCNRDSTGWQLLLKGSVHTRIRPHVICFEKYHDAQEAVSRFEMDEHQNLGSNFTRLRIVKSIHLTEVMGDE